MTDKDEIIAAIQSLEKEVAKLTATMLPAAEVEGVDKIKGAIAMPDVMSKVPASKSKLRLGEPYRKVIYPRDYLVDDDGDVF